MGDITRAEEFLQDWLLDTVPANCPLTSLNENDVRAGTITRTQFLGALRRLAPFVRYSDAIGETLMHVVTEADNHRGRPNITEAQWEAAQLLPGELAAPSPLFSRPSVATNQITRFCHPQHHAFIVNTLR